MKKPIPKINLLIIILLCIGLLGPGAMTVGSPRLNVHPALLQAAAENPRQMVSVIVQKAGLDNRVETAVTRMGGRLTKDLSLIRAFAAEMSARSAVVLARNPGVRWVSPDAQMLRSSISTSTVRDEFTSRTYSNNNGTTAWSGNWVEMGEADGTVYGRVRVGSSWKCAANYCLQFTGSNANLADKGVWRMANSRPGSLRGPPAPEGATRGKRTEAVLVV